MADKDNVISLQERLRSRKQAREQVQEQEQGSLVDPTAWQPADLREATGAGSGPGQGDPANTDNTTALPGKLVWLHCPACGTYQYTEVVMSGGRVHNVCGNTVEEVTVDIDVRAEFTVAQINLERLTTLATMLEHEQQRYQEYQHRLGLVAGHRVEPYPVTEEVLKTLPIVEIGPLGLLESEAMHNPAQCFAPSEEPAETGEENGPTTDGDPTPEPSNFQPDPTDS